jgi:hypothetical protein
MFQTGYHATGYYQTGYYLGGAEIPAPARVEEEDLYGGVRVAALREEEELLMICAAFIEIIRCRH